MKFVYYSLALIEAVTASSLAFEAEQNDIALPLVDQLINNGFVGFSTHNDCLEELGEVPDEYAENVACNAAEAMVICPPDEECPVPEKKCACEIQLIPVLLPVLEELEEYPYMYDDAEEAEDLYIAEPKSLEGDVQEELTPPELPLLLIEPVTATITLDVAVPVQEEPIILDSMVGEPLENVREEVKTLPILSMVGEPLEIIPEEEVFATAVPMIIPVYEDEPEPEPEVLTKVGVPLEFVKEEEVFVTAVPMLVAEDEDEPEVADETDAQSVPPTLEDKLVEHGKVKFNVVSDGGCYDSIDKILARCKVRGFKCYCKQRRQPKLF